MKLQSIYIFYIADNNCNNDVYKLHYYFLEQLSYILDKMTFIILYDNKQTDDIVYRVKSKLINICKCKEVQFIMEPNNSDYREGLYFKKYIIDKLDKYDEYLTFFGHTKGVTNPNGLNNLKNLYTWICFLYYFNIHFINEITRKLNTNSIDEDYITYGSLYFKDYRHNNVHNWFYSGSFYWINTYKLNKYINDNNIDINPFICKENERLKRCAELFIGSCLPSKYAAFHNDQFFNKETEHFHNSGWEISYNGIDGLINPYVNIGDINEYVIERNKIMDQLNIKIFE